MFRIQSGADRDVRPYVRYLVLQNNKQKKRLATAVADFLGYAVWAPVNILKNRATIPSPAEIREILVIRTAYIGDVVMTLPVLKPLKELYPHARVTFLTAAKAAEILYGNPYVDEVLTYDAFWFYPSGGFRDYLNFVKRLRQKKYDLVIEARGDIRDILLLAYLANARYRVSYRAGGGGYLLTHIVPFEGIKHKIEYHLDMVRFLGQPVGEIEWGVYLSQAERQEATELLSRMGISASGPLVGIHPGARKELKMWTPEGYAWVADQLISQYGARIIFTSSKEETALIERIQNLMQNQSLNLGGRLSLRQLAGMMEHYRVFICNDSAPMHISAAMGTPTVAIFGPSKSRETAPYGPKHRTVEKDFPCRLSCDEDVCNHEIKNLCMKEIKPEDVLRAVTEILT